MSLLAAQQEHLLEEEHSPERPSVRAFHMLPLTITID
jgi:hypothetical protein